MATTTPLFTCGACDKQFASAAGLRGHQNKTGHKGSALIPAGEKVARPAKNPKEAKVAEEKKAAKPAKTEAEKAAEAQAKVEAREKAKADRAEARAADRASRPCEDGCGGIPAGFKSRFLPGHDAKKASAEKAAETATA